MRCGCSAPGVLDCTCVLVDQQCIDVAGAGSQASPYTLTPILDPDANNLLTCGASGLLSSFSDVLPQVDAGSASLTIVNNTLTPIDFTNELYDTDGMHSNVTNPSRLTAQTAGIYIATGFSSFVNTLGMRTLTIRKNGADELVQKMDASPFFCGITLLTVVHLAVTDYLELTAFQDSGAGAFAGFGFKASMVDRT